MGIWRIFEISNRSRQGASNVKEMLKEYKRLEKAWINVERRMRDTEAMNMCALFWNEVAGPFYADMTREPEKAEMSPLWLPPRKLPPREKKLRKKKLELMNWVKWILIFVFCFALILLAF
ncbi:unnamed protein product [Cochlearia groenlandica]